MQPNSTVSYDWKTPSPTHRYRTGVSLHSHTSHSIESLLFIHSMFMESRPLRSLFSYYERVSRDRHNLTLDFVAANWRPPLMPRMAFDLESRQIRDLGLRPLVSITDHDDIQAPLQLRTMPSSRHIPMSLEWSVPFGTTAFHMGVHNLPSATALQWMDRLAQFTAEPDETKLGAILADLHANPHVLVVLNHPLWDLYKIGAKAHGAELDRFLLNHNDVVHALELNGLRHSRENSDVVTLASRWGQLLISGGDRHGMEPNANINLTDATNFNDFVQEIRVERRSHVLFLKQYSRSWGQRIMESTLDAVVDHATFVPGWQKWDERAFHPDAQGVMRPFSELWVKGKAPRLLRVAIGAVRLLRHRAVSQALGRVLADGGTDLLGAKSEVA